MRASVAAVPHPVPEARREAAVVLNMYATGLAIARSLSRHGVQVFGLSAHAHAPGNYSRSCRHVRCSDSQEEPVRLLEELLVLADSIPGRPVLFPTRDADVLFLDRHRDVLEPRYRIPQVDGAVLDSIMNKHRLAEASRKAGIDSPRTATVRSTRGLRQAVAELQFPLVLKPVYAQDWRDPAVASAVGRRKAIRAGTIGEAEDLVRRLEPFGNDVLLQEWIDGPDDRCFVLGAYRSRSGRWNGWFTARKLLQFPPEFGLGCVVRLADLPDVRELGMRLLEFLNFWGTAEVEFKQDGNTGNYRLIEVNPRHWDQHALGLAGQVDLAFLAYSDLCGNEVTDSSQPSAWGSYWISGSGLIQSVKWDLKRLRVRPRFWSGLLRPGTRYAVWDPADPGPFLRSLRGTRHP